MAPSERLAPSRVGSGTVGVPRRPEPYLEPDVRAMAMDDNQSAYGMACRLAAILDSELGRLERQLKKTRQEVARLRLRERQARKLARAMREVERLNVELEERRPPDGGQAKADGPARDTLAAGLLAAASASFDGASGSS